METLFIIQVIMIPLCSCMQDMQECSDSLLVDDYIAARNFVLGMFLIMVIVSTICIHFYFLTIKSFHSRMIKKEQNIRRIKADVLSEIHEKTIEYKQKQVHQDKQIEILGNYLLDKVGVSNKLKELQFGTESRPVLNQNDWEEIRMYLDTTEGMFVSRMEKEFPKLTENDIRFLMLLRLKVPTKRLASYYAISEKSIKQKLFTYKVKLDIKPGGLSLRQFVNEY